MASTEPPQPVKHKTCVLRVSIHCEGCKRKVSKILRSIPGVQYIEIERQNHRVLVTGDVSPENLVRKLVKSGKHAELWPENPPQNHIRITEKLHGNEEIVVSGREIKQPETKTEKPAVEFAVSGTEIKPPATKAEVPTLDSSKSVNPIVQSGGSPAGNGGGKAVEDVGAKVAVEVKTEEKKRETGSVSDSPSPSVVQKEEKQTGNDGGVAAGGVGGSGEKKKKKKKKEGQNSNITSSIGEKSSSSPRQQTTNRSSNQSPPRQHGYKYPAPHHHVPPPAPVYTMSYNTAHPPVNSYTASYHAAAAPPPQSYAYSHFGPPITPPPQSYAFSHFGTPMAPPAPPLSEYHSYTQQPVDSFEMFSDENPNGCLVM